LAVLLTAVGVAGVGCDATSQSPSAASAKRATTTQATRSVHKKKQKKERESKPAQPAQQAVRVGRIVDGDTLELTDGRRVRLVQIDTPELGEGECYSEAAARDLARLAPQEARIRLEADPALDQLDRYGRLLRYVVRGQMNVNVELVRRGAASPWFYDGDRGRYAATLLAAAQRAKAAKRGLWGACPETRLDPLNAVTTSAPKAQGLIGGSRSCDPAYPDFCIPPPPPDLDCADVGRTRFTVRSPDPHGFDGDHDGIGCES
jgi:endonuclease YncB( thermonuclease family)